jgi:pimeloyl-ACP methyl ester carboxylesterase
LSLTIQPAIRADAGDLPRPVAEALAKPHPGRRSTVAAGDIPWSVLEWGRPDDPPLLLIHGVTSSSGVWWRIGPALAATGRRVVAIDLPGHGRTGNWTGHHRFRDNAADVAAFIRAAGLDVPSLQVIGHSWGAMTTAALPAAGIRPATIVLLDPPAIPFEFISARLDDPVDRPYDDVDDARAAIRTANPGWADGDVDAKARALVEMDPEAVRAVLVDNGDWDAGLADLAHPAAAGVPIWIVRGEEATGGYLPEMCLPALADRIGAERIITIADGPHSPQRTHPEATLVAFLRALSG